MLKKIIFSMILGGANLLSTPDFPEVINYGQLKLFQDSFLYDESGSWTNTLANYAYELGYIAFNDSPEIGTFISYLNKTYDLDVAIETGTFFGATTLFFSLYFDDVYTIEAKESFYYDAMARFKDRSNIHCCRGSSEQVFKQILPELKSKRVLFYLDAHTYFQEAVQSGYHYWPILEELEEISKTHHDNCIIVIDDFKVPYTDIHGCVDFNGQNELSHELIRDKLNKIFSGYSFHYLIPKNSSRAAKFVAIPKKWQHSSYSGRVDVLPGLDFWDLPIKLNNVKDAGIEIRVVNQFYNGHDEGHYVRDILYDNELKKIVVINNTVDPLYLYQFPKDKVVLFLLEPLKLSNSYYEPCSRVYTWNDDLIDNKKFFKLYYPYLMPMEANLPPFEAKKLCAMVSGSDNAYPERKNELYSERMKMVEFFETKPEGEFDIYGRHWVKRHYRDFRGPIPGDHSGKEKISVLKKYRFSICFENTKDLSGYISEKIFGSFAAGCVPIYWGAKNIDTFIPKGCFIDYRDFANNEELYQFIKTMPKHVYEQYLNRIRAFINSDQAQLFSPAYFEKIFYEAIQ